jgi:hypothetical protein
VKSQHVRISALAVGTILLSLTFANAAHANSEQATRQYFAGGGKALCSLSPTFCPDRARASNGDTVTIAGSGRFNPDEEDASGRGTFVHKNSAGAVLASGTWRAEELISWKSFGLAGPGFPAGFEGGVAVLRVHLTPSGGGEKDGSFLTRSTPLSGEEKHERGLDALLTITCVLGTPVAGADEGIHLNVIGGPNFSDSIGGNTLFIVTPED